MYRRSFAPNKPDAEKFRHPLMLSTTRCNHWSGGAGKVLLVEVEAPLRERSMLFVRSEATCTDTVQPPDS